MKDSGVLIVLILYGSFVVFALIRLIFWIIKKKARTDEEAVSPGTLRGMNLEGASHIDTKCESEENVRSIKIIYRDASSKTAGWICRTCEAENSITQQYCILCGTAYNKEAENVL